MRKTETDGTTMLHSVLQVRSRNELRVGGASAAPGHLLSAARGLVQRQGRLYVIADDEHQLAVIDAASATGHWVRMFDGELPDAPKARKAAKPDLETLLELPPASELLHGGLLALGSGSRANRCHGVILAFDARGELTEPRLIDMAALYAPLQSDLGDLNIEGAVLRGDDLLLLHRANQSQPRNACLRFAWLEVWRWLQGGGGAVPLARDTVDYDLGAIDDVALGFTDANALPAGQWLFSAVAEATHDSYHDGVCVGTAIGIVAADGRLRALHRLAGRWKVEGVAATVLADAQTLELTLVTDADDRSQPASCLTVQLALGA